MRSGLSENPECVLSVENKLTVSREQEKNLGEVSSSDLSPIEAHRVERARYRCYWRPTVVDQ